MKLNKKQVIVLLGIVFSLSIIVSAVSINNTQNNIIGITLNNTNLAKVFNEDNLGFDKAYRLRYLQKNNYFSYVKFKNLTDNERYALKVGAKNDRIRGINISGNNFVIDLLYCELNGRYCAFRINGVPAAQLHSFEEFGTSRKNSFDIDQNYVLKVNSIKFNQCDNKRFCHLGYEGYNIVDVSVEKKK